MWYKDPPFEKRKSGKRRFRLLHFEHKYEMELSTLWTYGDVNASRTRRGRPCAESRLKVPQGS